MKKSYLLAALAITGLTSCSNDLFDDGANSSSDSNVISFENTLTNNATRTSKENFANADAMGIYGFQDTDTKIFNNQVVSYDGTDWTYSPLKYWNAGSSYEFYGFYPSSSSIYSFDETTRNYKVTDYTVADAIADQTDLMIAEKNTTAPYNTVNMNYNHILSGVHFFAKLSSNVADAGLSKVTVNKLIITGLKNMGSFEQDGFDGTTANVKGTWSDLNGEYPFPSINPTEVAKTLTAGKMGTTGNIVRDLLMVPQPLEATLYVEYTINYTDGSATTFKKSLPLESIKASGVAVDKWEMNTIYKYTMTLDPTKANVPDYDNTKIDWDGSTNGDCEPTPKSTLVGPDADGNYKVEVDDNEDGTPDHIYPVVWEDIDGDGKLEGGVDRDGDGKIDNVDGEDTNNADPSAPGHDNVTDGNTNNPDGKDAILVDTDGDGKPDTQLEREPGTKVEPEDATDQPDDPSTPSGKAYTIDWNGSQDETGAASTDAEDETKPVEYSRLVVDEKGDYYVQVDVDKDGSYDGATDTQTKVNWADLDGDGKLEGYLGNIDGENTKNVTSDLVTDGDTKLNPKGYDVILIDTNDDGVCDKQLEKEYNGQVTPSEEGSTVITFDATIEDWSNRVNPTINIIQ